jgi:putative acetyltransferase
MLAGDEDRSMTTTGGPANVDPILRPATNADAAAVRELVFGVLREFGLKPSPGDTDADLDDLEAAYHRRGGRFDVLVTPDGAVIGSVGLYPVDPTTVELRKMYLQVSARGRGLGRRLLDHALAEARRMGFARMTLETASVLTDAVALYERYGFRPYAAAHRSSRCDASYALPLTPTPDPDAP